MRIFDIVEELEKERKKNKELEIEIKQLRNARYSLDRVELEERIDKAISYIENEMSHLTTNGIRTRKHLLNILKGDNK